MKKFLCLVFSISIVSIGSISLAAGYYCPSEAEYKAKQNYYMQKISSPTISTEDFLRTSKENDAYDLSVFKNCLGYFKTAQNPDCTKFSSLRHGYLSQLGTNESEANAQMYAMLNVLGNKCQPEQFATKVLLQK